jgi:S1-C subfamily serine protease
MVFQTSVQIQPGNNDGPFLNQSGQVISITQARLDSKVDIGTLSTLTQNVNYSIKSSFISSLLPILQETLFASRGIGVVPTEPENSMSNFIYRTKKILF